MSRQCRCPYCRWPGPSHGRAPVQTSLPNPHAWSGPRQVSGRRWPIALDHHAPAAIWLRRECAKCYHAWLAHVRFLIRCTMTRKSFVRGGMCTACTFLLAWQEVADIDGLIPVRHDGLVDRINAMADGRCLEYWRSPQLDVIAMKFGQRPFLASHAR